MCIVQTSALLRLPLQGAAIIPGPAIGAPPSTKSKICGWIKKLFSKTDKKETDDLIITKLTRSGPLTRVELSSLTGRVLTALRQFELHCPGIPFAVDETFLRNAICETTRASRVMLGISNDAEFSLIDSHVPNIFYVIAFERDGSKNIFLVFTNIRLGEGSTKTVTVAVDMKNIEDQKVAFLAKAGKHQPLRLEAATASHLVEQIGYLPPSLDVDRTCQPPLNTLERSHVRGGGPVDSTYFLDTQTYLFAKFGGHSLDSILKDTGRTFTTNELIEIFIQIAEGLRILHETKTAHNDIKPANILVRKNPDGTSSTQVTDFDLSRPFGISNGGTMSVLSPEGIAQLRIKRSYTCGPETDVWSFGATLFMTLYRLEHGNVMTDGQLRQFIGIVSSPVLTQSTLNAFIESNLAEPKHRAAVCRILRVNPAGRPTVGSLPAMLDAMRDSPQPPAPTSSLSDID